MWNPLKWWSEREKKTAVARKDLVTKLPKKTRRSSNGTSKASREQKRQKRARMITRRNP